MAATMSSATAASITTPVAAHISGTIISGTAVWICVTVAWRRTVVGWPVIARAVIAWSWNSDSDANRNAGVGWSCGYHDNTA